MITVQNHRWSVSSIRRSTMIIEWLTTKPLWSRWLQILAKFFSSSQQLELSVADRWEGSEGPPPPLILGRERRNDRREVQGLDPSLTMERWIVLVGQIKVKYETNTSLEIKLHKHETAITWHQKV